MDSPDVIVIGGGPAGSTTATLLAQGGRRVLLLDREPFPRFRIGESLMPATYWTLERLGVVGKMQQSHFPKKYSVQFYSSSGRSSVPFYFFHVDPHESSQTWQVDRGEFDALLLEHARSCGVEVQQPVNVKEVRFEGDRAVGVTAEWPDGSRRELGAQVVVDASGQTGLISRALRLKEMDPQLRHAAVFTRYRNARRDPGIDEGATLVLWTRERKSWFWFIPLPGPVTSIGVVGPMDYLVGGRSADPLQVFQEEVDACTELKQRLAGAERVMEMKVLRDFSYISSRIAGDGWVLAGDAFGFLDPIYSSGVLLALTSGELAADSILDAFRRGDFSAEVLGAHGDRYLTGMEQIRKLVYAFYHPHFSFGEFLRAHPDCRDLVTHVLMGNVFRHPVGELFETMERTIPLPEVRRLGNSPCSSA
ncbi:MAG TPA: NAD(P)/FAD-dependent oxidoreductase [Candidatus Polarisedimenticolaceae bacterium]|nr:NAD(P)/FAD-dependent oxidoreductase [Candidatus Polarisedimenticolaceae bacterium]